MRVFAMGLMLSAGLAFQPVWADHHNDRRDQREERRDDRRDRREDRRDDRPRLFSQPRPQYGRDERDARDYQSRDYQRRDYPPRYEQRDFQQRDFQQREYSRGPQSGFLPRNDFAQPRSDFSAGDAARRAQQMNGGGRILSVDPNGPGYRVKVLKEGEVRVLSVPDGG